MTNGQQKVAVVNCVLMLSVDVEYVGPDLTPIGSLVLTRDERRLRNELQVDCCFLQQHLMILLARHTIHDLLLAQFGERSVRQP